jgi:hypothetical protein
MAVGAAGADRALRGRQTPRSRLGSTSGGIVGRLAKTLLSGELGGLKDRPRPGRPRRFPPEQVAEVKAISCSYAQRTASFSRASAALSFTVWLSSGGSPGLGLDIRRWLSEDAIRPRQVRSWIFRRDADFRVKAEMVLDLYAGALRGTAASSRVGASCCRRRRMAVTCVGASYDEMARPVRRCRTPRRLPGICKRLCHPAPDQSDASGQRLSFMVGWARVAPPRVLQVLDGPGYACPPVAAPLHRRRGELENRRTCG